MGEILFQTKAAVKLLVALAVLLPVTALAEGLRSTLSAGAGVPAGYWSLLGLWTVLGFTSVVLWFRWE